MLGFLFGVAVGVFFANKYMLFTTSPFIRPRWEETRSRLKFGVLNEELVEMGELSGRMLDRMTDTIIKGTK